MTAPQIITASCLACADIILLLLLIGVLISGNLKDKIYRVFLIMTALLLAGSMTEVALLIPFKIPGVDPAMLSRTLDFLDYAFGCVIRLYFTIYICEYLSIRVGVPVKKPVLAVKIIEAVQLLLLLFVLLYRIIIWPNELPVAAQWLDVFNISMILPTVTLAVCVACTVNSIKFLSVREWVSLISYVVIALVCYGIETTIPDIWVSYLGSAIALFLMYINIHIELNRRVQEQERQLAESHVAIMLSQIQPHFLYNTLSAIESFCKEEGAEKATEIVRSFSKYLRGNMESLSRKHPIAFSKELEHTKQYLAIEQMQYDGKLKVNYDIRADDFLLPALTLQPIVENAVKHGVSKRYECGTVLIRAEETDAGFRVTVIDDGVGFDGESLKDGAEHIGIANVRNRLAGMCGGGLKIVSCPGIGTEAVITVPKRRIYARGSAE